MEINQSLKILSFPEKKIDHLCTVAVRIVSNMPKKAFYILLVALIMPVTEAAAQAKTLSENAKISMLTCGPGEAVYSKFGHSALWVYDPSTRTDRIYNYGTFDFYSNRFYIEFVKGTAMYNLSVTGFMNFFEEYVSENRSIAEQELNLRPDEKQYLFELLEENYKPENRHYLYDFLFQNCSSLIRDIVWKATENRFMIPAASEETHTFRSMMDEYLEDTPWLMNGMYLLLGHRADREANPWDQMYLPDYMFDWFEAATDTSGKSLVKGTRTLFIPQSVSVKTSFLSKPRILLPAILLLIFFITVMEIRKKKNYRLLDSLILFIMGIMGLLMIYMWCCSKHLVTHENLNLIWAVPFHLIFAVMVLIRKLDNITRYYSQIMSALAILFLALFWFFPQSIPPVAFWSCAIIAVRLVRRAFFSSAPAIIQQ